MSNENLVKYLPLLTKTERKVLVGLMTSLDENFEAGTLPFQRRNVVRLCVMGAIQNVARTDLTMNAMRSIINKLKANEPRSEFVLYLDSAKVAKRFGTKPELGKPINVRKLPFVTGHKVIDGVNAPVTSQLSPMVALRCAGANLWRVSCDPRAKEEVKEWLVQYCR